MTTLDKAALSAADFPTGWLIHKAGRGWYRPNAEGYTNATSEAGRYSYEEALSYSHPNGWDGPRDGITLKHESEIDPPAPADNLVERLRDAERVREQMARDWSQFCEAMGVRFDTQEAVASELDARAASLLSRAQSAEARVKVLEEAVRPFANYAPFVEMFVDGRVLQGGSPVLPTKSFRLADFQRAARALNGDSHNG